MTERDKLIRCYISAYVWTFGIVPASDIAENFGGEVEEVLAVGKKFAEMGDVFSVRRELFVSAYAFDGWRFSEIKAFAETMPKERRKLELDEIMLYFEKSYEPTFPVRERLRDFLETTIGDIAPVCLNHLEKESRLGRLTASTANEIYLEYSGGKTPQNKVKFEKLVMDFIKGCPNWTATKLLSRPF
jgi:hypothetical protein